MADADTDLANAIFKVLVIDLDSKTKLPNDRLESHFPFGTDHIAFFRKHSDRFMLFENAAGLPCMIGARCNLLKLCHAYGRPRGRHGSYCNRPVCPEIHICMDHVSGYCRDGMECQKDHHFQGNHNKTVLQGLGLLSYEGDKLLNLLQMTTPQVCRWHNKRVVCPNGEACTRFHICGPLVQNRCVGNELCQKGHSFDTAHSRRLLEAYKLTGKPEREILDRLLLHKVKPPTREPENQADLLDLIRRLRDGVTVPDTTDDLEEELVITEKVKPDVKVPERILENLALNQQALIDDDFLMLQEALGDEDVDLINLLCYQQEIDNQKIIEAQPVKQEVTGEAVIGADPDELPVAADQGHVTNQVANQMAEPELGLALEGAAAALPKAQILPAPEQNLAIYTGYAPQDDKEYLCAAVLQNKCNKDAQTCRYAHYVSPFLWQVRVKEMWYNLDTVNNDIEEAFKRNDRDYITMMPNESPEFAGRLMTIDYPRLRAQLTKDEEDDMPHRPYPFRRRRDIFAIDKDTETFRVRRLVCKENPEPVELDPETIDVLRDIEPETFEELLKKHQKVEKIKKKKVPTATLR